jgi:hypothetical protein
VSEPPRGASDQGPAGSSTADDPGVTLTWLMHDVAVWRVDRIYLNAAGGPWVATQQDVTGDGSFLGQDPVWHKLGNGKEVAALLDGLGVGPSGTGRVAGEPVRPPAVTPVAAQPEPAPVWAGWWWGPAGLLLGAAGMLALQRRRRAGPAEPDAPGSWDAELDHAAEGHPVPARGA